jgi:hypothetical protein
MKRFSIILILLLWTSHIYSQKDVEDLLDELSDLTGIEINITTGTFKSTRIMNGHSVERMAPGNFDFRISHRFGRINSGAYEFFGLDQANIHLGMEYGIA